MHSSFRTLLKMLSVKIWLRLVNLVGEVMLGIWLVEYMMSIKSETFLFESHFGRSILKSSSNTTYLFSTINFLKRGFKHWSLNSLCCMHACLYITLQQCFWSLIGLFQQKLTPVSFFHKSLNLVSVYNWLLFWYTATLPC